MPTARISPSAPSAQIDRNTSTIHPAASSPRDANLHNHTASQTQSRLNRDVTLTSSSSSSSPSSVTSCVERDVIIKESARTTSSTPSTAADTSLSSTLTTQLVNGHRDVGRHESLSSKPGKSHLIQESNDFLVRNNVLHHQENQSERHVMTKKESSSNLYSCKKVSSSGGNHHNNPGERLFFLLVHLSLVLYHHLLSWP